MLVVVDGTVYLRHSPEVCLCYIEPSLLLCRSPELVQRRRNARMHRTVHTLLTAHRFTQHHHRLLDFILRHQGAANKGERGRSFGMIVSVPRADDGESFTIVSFGFSEVL